MSRSISSSSVESFAIRRLVKRVRPESVEAELRQMEGCDAKTVVRIAAQKGRGQLSKEALVAVIRSYAAVGARDRADIIFLELVRRLSGAVANKLVRWNSVAGADEEDTRQSIIVHLHQYIYSLDAGEELWECNFKTCFDLRILNIFGRLTRGRPTTISMEGADSQDDEDRSIDVPDQTAQQSFESVEIRDALLYLDKIDPRLGKVFYLKFFGDLAEHEIASVMDVHERTVRNWISASRKTLKQYYAEL